MTPSASTSWVSRVMAAAVTLLAVAVAARVVWEFLAPLIPPLIVLMVLVGIGSIALGRFRRW